MRVSYPAEHCIHCVVKGSRGILMADATSCQYTVSPTCCSKNIFEFLHSLAKAFTTKIKTVQESSEPEHSRLDEYNLSVLSS